MILIKYKMSYHNAVLNLKLIAEIIHLLGIEKSIVLFLQNQLTIRKNKNWIKLYKKFIIILCFKNIKLTKNYNLLYFILKFNIFIRKIRIKSKRKKRFKM